MLLVLHFGEFEGCVTHYCQIEWNTTVCSRLLSTSFVYVLLNHYSSLCAENMLKFLRKEPPKSLMFWKLKLRQLKKNRQIWSFWMRNNCAMVIKFVSYISLWFMLPFLPILPTLHMRLSLCDLNCLMDYAYEKIMRLNETYIFGEAPKSTYIVGGCLTHYIGLCSLHM